jgi:hypothetical protein
MGCDIHLYVEKRADAFESLVIGQQWVSVDKWSPDPYAEDEGQSRLWVAFDDRMYFNRNYDLFAMLAGVRNGRGFAGIPTGTGFNSISEPRGLPEDVSPEVKAESEAWGCDGHSHSWLTVAELLRYDWNQTTKHTGMVNMWEFATFQKTGKPKAWCGDVSGRTIKKISNQEMAERVYQNQGPIDEFMHATALLANPDADPKEATQALVKVHEQTLEITKGDEFSYYTRIYWYETYSDAAGQFLIETLPKLQALGKPEDVRIVFFFDN